MQSEELTSKKKMGDPILINDEKSEITKEKESSKKCYLPARLVLTFLLFWGMCLVHGHRVCIGVTIVAMVNHTTVNAPNASSKDNSTCPNLLVKNETDPNHQGEYLWTPSAQGMILGAYFFGYISTQMLGGRLAELAGGKWPLGLSIFVGSLLTIMTPLSADIGVAAIVSLRVLMGVLHGICLPAAFAMFAHWAPAEEKNTLLSLCFVGDHVGTILSMPLAGYLCKNGFDGGWPSVFYILGILGCIWFVFWACLVHNRPADHPRISLKELDYIQKGHIQIEDDQKSPVPWRRVLCSMPVWSVAIVAFCSAWGQTTLLTKLPTFLELVLHVPIQKNGLVNSLIYVCCCVTLFISGYLSDYLRSNKGYDPTKVRKGFQIIAMVGPAVCTALIPFVGCRKNMAIALLTFSMAFLGLCGGGYVSIAVDMAPHHAATIFGLINGLGGTAGVFSPLVAGFILNGAHASIEQWSSVFYLSAGLYMLGGIIFLIWASADRQPWAYIDSREQCLVYPAIGEKEVTFKGQDDLEKSCTYDALT